MPRAEGREVLTDNEVNALVVVATLVVRELAGFLGRWWRNRR